MPNQHSVSQFLTLPWQRRKGRKELVYYDFQTDRIEEAKPRDLFARPDIHSEHIDLRFRNLVEAPLGRLWKRVRKEGVVNPVSDWSELRAAHLVFMCQPLRIIDHSVNASTQERRLDDLVGKDDSYLDILVRIHMKEYELRIFRVPKGHCLFYPQTGVLGFPVMEDPRKKPLASVTGGFGIPLHPQILLTAVPKAAHEPWLGSLREMFHAFSVGLTGSCRRVIIPATVADQYERGELVTRIKATRELATEIFQQMVRMRELIGQMHRIAGLAQ